MKLYALFLSLAVPLFVGGCGGPTDPDAAADATRDALTTGDAGDASADGSRTDVIIPDAVIADADLNDVGTMLDGTTTMDGGADTATSDAIVTDTRTDTGTVTDTGTIADAGSIDGGSTDAGVSMDVPDAGPPVAWNQTCGTTTNCAAPTGQQGFCGLGFPSPICLHTCNTQGDYTLCENSAGICVPQGGGTKICLPKCGDASATACTTGQSCAMLGYRDNRAVDAGFRPIGICSPECSATVPCTTAGYACDIPSGVCRQTGCPNGCPSGSSCVGATCVPSPRIAVYGSCTPRSPTTSNGCDAQLCLASGTQPGYCTSYCTSDLLGQCGAGVCWTDGDSLTSTTGDVLGSPGGSFTVVGGRSSGLCLRSCNESADCPAGFHCGAYSGRRVCLLGANTQVIPQPGQGAGSLCRSNSDCASAACRLFGGTRDGVCQLAASGPCPSNTVGLTDGVTCLPGCTGAADGECPGSWVCDTSQGVGLCVPGICRDNNDCTTGYRCDPNSAQCVTTAFPGTGVVGAACTMNNQCQGNSCLMSFPQGYCTTGCTILADYSDTCPSDAICSTNTVGGSGACLDLCDASTGSTRFGACRTGYRCVSFSADPRFGFCTP